MAQGPERPPPQHEEPRSLDGGKGPACPARVDSEQVQAPSLSRHSRKRWRGAHSAPDFKSMSCTQPEQGSCHRQGAPRHLHTPGVPELTHQAPSPRLPWSPPRTSPPTSSRLTTRNVPPRLPQLGCCIM